jgi:hypothetical protein
MCLRANLEAFNGHTAPPRTLAWKFTETRRRPFFQTNGAYVPRGGYEPTKDMHYADGTVHAVLREDVLAQRQPDDVFTVYEFGLHVYTDLDMARAVRLTWVDAYDEPDGVDLIAVEVDPTDWVAEDTLKHEAVYTRLKVIGEVK